MVNNDKDHIILLKMLVSPIFYSGQTLEMRFHEEGESFREKIQTFFVDGVEKNRLIPDLEERTEHFTKQEKVKIHFDWTGESYHVNFRGGIFYEEWKLRGPENIWAFLEKLLDKIEDFDNYDLYSYRLGVETPNSGIRPINNLLLEKWGGEESRVHYNPNLIVNPKGIEKYCEEHGMEPIYAVK